MYLFTISKKLGTRLHAALIQRFDKTHSFSLIKPFPANEEIELHSQVKEVPGAGRDGYLIQGFIKGFLAAAASSGSPPPFNQEELQDIEDALSFRAVVLEQEISFFATTTMRELVRDQIDSLRNLQRTTREMIEDCNRKEEHEGG